ncbi:MAG: hypothetical protein HY240_09520 [Actinobacteria bacterium]|nr:hypothetical protein [Actinomycetota bacterium]
MTDARHAPPSRPKPVVFAAVAAGALLLIGGIFLAVSGKGPLAGVVPGTSKSPERVTPSFDFVSRKTSAIATVATGSESALKRPAQQASKQTTAVLDTLYTEGFLNPDNWTSGSYDSAFEVFDPAAAEQARAEADTLTAGAGAGATYDDIQPGRGAVVTNVLMDAKGQPSYVAAKVSFVALGTNKDGTTTVFVSKGQFFLQMVNGQWKVVAFEVTRNDRVNQPEPSTSGSGTPTGSPS